MYQFQLYHEIYNIRIKIFNYMSFINDFIIEKIKHIMKLFFVEIIFYSCFQTLEIMFLVSNIRDCYHYNSCIELIHRIEYIVFSS